MKPLRFSALIILLTFSFAACGDGTEAPDDTEEHTESATAAPAADLPIQEVKLGPLDAEMAAEGQQIFETRCTTCHRLDERYVGPPLGDILEQQEPEYVMNMILAPEKMLQTNPHAQELLAEYGVPMTNQNLTEDEARAILEYLRQVHEGA